MDKTDGSNPSANAVASVTSEAPAKSEASTKPGASTKSEPVAQSEPLATPEPSEIPVAVRETSKLPPDRRLSQTWKLVIFGLVGFFLALAAGAFVAWKTTSPIAVSPGEPSSVEVAETASPAVTTLPSGDENTSTTTPALSEENVLGHLPYEVAPPETLVPVAVDSSIRLRQAATEKLDEMVAAAESEGVYLVPVSGFRTVEDQEYLFFDVKAERGENPAERAEVSAPPGYSEHHTGYAIDILDGDRSDIGLVEEFEQTRAFQWLQQNAAYYSFELSFPRNNVQNVNYEPWHWRFVGDRHSLETFYRASNLAPNSASPSTPSSETPSPDSDT